MKSGYFPRVVGELSLGCSVFLIISSESTPIPHAHLLDLFDVVEVPRDVGILWGTDYLNRTGTAKSNMYDNRPEETKYIYTDDDSQGKQLDGRNTHAITCQGGSASGHGLLVAHLVQLSAFLQPKQAEPILARHKEQNLKVRYGWLTHALYRCQIARSG